MTATTVAATASYADLFRDGKWGKSNSGLVREIREAGLESWLANPDPRIPVLPAAQATELQEPAVAPYRIADTLEAVFVDGHYAAHLSRLDGFRRGLFSPLSALIDQPPELVEMHLGRHAGDDPVAALNAAFLREGAVVAIDPHEQVDAPIHLLHIHTGAQPTAHHLRTLVVAGSRSSATVVETHVALPGAAHTLTTAVTEMVVGRAARLHRVKLQRESLHAEHYARTAIRQDGDANVTDTLFSLGAHTSQQAVTSLLEAPGAEVRLNGLLLATGDQSMSCPTSIDHAKPNTTIHELYKAVLDGNARGDFVGSVKVRADAQKTNSDQQNRNLLLSPGARMDTTPQLEIHADDVKCSHGSTIGQLSKDALFFLRSRGLSEEAGRLILTKAFAHEVIEQAPDVVRPLMDDLLTQWFACRTAQGKVA